MSADIEPGQSNSFVLSVLMYSHYVLLREALVSLGKVEFEVKRQNLRYFYLLPMVLMGDTIRKFENHRSL